MGQPDNTEEKKTDTTVDSSTLNAYREQINQISKFINFMPQWELASDYGRVKKIELQIADVIDNLKILNVTSSGKRFNKGTILKHLSNARNELNIASRLAGASNPRTQIMCFEHIAKCLEYLDLAQGLMASRGG